MKRRSAGSPGIAETHFDPVLVDVFLRCHREFAEIRGRLTDSAMGAAVSGKAWMIAGESLREPLVLERPARWEVGRSNEERRSPPAPHAGRRAHPGGARARRTLVATDLSADGAFLRAPAAVAPDVRLRLVAGDPHRSQAHRGHRPRRALLARGDRPALRGGLGARPRPPARPRRFLRDGRGDRPRPAGARRPRAGQPAAAGRAVRDPDAAAEPGRARAAGDRHPARPRLRAGRLPGGRLRAGRPARGHPAARPRGAARARGCSISPSPIRRSSTPWRGSCWRARAGGPR